MPVSIAAFLGNWFLCEVGRASACTFHFLPIPRTGTGREQGAPPVWKVCTLLTLLASPKVKGSKSRQMAIWVIKTMNRELRSQELGGGCALGMHRACYWMKSTANGPPLEAPK